MQLYSSMTKNSRKQVLKLQKKCRFQVKETQQEGTQLKQKMRRLSCFNNKITITKINKAKSQHKNSIQSKDPSLPKQGNKEKTIKNLQEYHLVQDFLKNFLQGKNEHLYNAQVKKQLIKLIFSNTPFGKHIQNIIQKESVLQKQVQPIQIPNLIPNPNPNPVPVPRCIPSLSISRTVCYNLRVKNEIMLSRNSQIDSLNEQLQYKWKEKALIENSIAFLTSTLQQKKKQTLEMGLKIELLQYQLMKYTKIKEKMQANQQSESSLTKVANKCKAQQDRLMQFSKSTTLININSEVNYFNTLTRQLRFSLNNIWHQLQHEEKDTGRHTQIRALMENFLKAIQPIVHPSANQINTMGQANASKQAHIKTFEGQIRNYAMLNADRKEACMRIKKEYALALARLQCTLDKEEEDHNDQNYHHTTTNEHTQHLNNTNTSQATMKGLASGQASSTSKKPSRNQIMKYIKSLQNKFNKLSLFC